MSVVKIIIGAIDSGKSSRAKELFQSYPPGTAEGLLTLKFYSPEQVFLGYRLRRASTGEERSFIRLRSTCEGKSTEELLFDRFAFSPAAFDWGESVFAEALASPAIHTLFLDEIGPIELRDQGFARVQQQALASDKELYLVMNDRNLVSLLEHFRISEYELLT